MVAITSASRISRTADRIVDRLKRVGRGNAQSRAVDRGNHQAIRSARRRDSRCRPDDSVPSCPGWNVGQLVRHVDGGHRWVTEMVSTLADEPASDTSFRDLSVFTDEDPALLGPILTEGAELLAATLGETDPDAPMWTPTPHGTAGFYARRFAHETAMHRADAELALRADFALDAELAVDGIEEWLELGSTTFSFRNSPADAGTARSWSHHRPAHRRLCGELGGRLTGDAIEWRRGVEDAAVSVTGLVTDLLLVIYERRGRSAIGGSAGNATCSTSGLSESISADRLHRSAAAVFVFAVHPARARRPDRDIRARSGQLELAGDDYRLVVAAEPLQAFVVAVQAPHISGVLARPGSASGPARGRRRTPRRLPRRGPARGVTRRTRAEWAASIPMVRRRATRRRVRSRDAGARMPRRNRPSR